MSTAVVVVRTALYTALTADAQLMALLGGVYDEQAPEGATGNYLILGGTAEDEAGTMGNEGKAGLESLRIVTRPGANERPGGAKAKAIYVHVERILNGKALPVSGRGMYLGRTRLVTTFLEPDRKTTVAPVEYTFRTMEPVSG